MHRLLERQLRRRFGELSAVPEEWRTFLDDVNQAYEASDADRALLERSLELTSQELTQRYTRMRAQQREIETIVDSVPAFIWFKDRDGRILRCNRSAAESIGKTRAEIEGRPSAELYPEEADQFKRDDIEVMLSGVPKRGILEPLQVADGTKRWIRADKLPYLDDEGRVIGVIVFAIDVTAQKVAEDELKNAYERLREVDRFRSQFINNAAHELGTPLTPMKLQIHMLRNQSGTVAPDNERRSIEILHRSFERLEHLVSDVLDASRLQTGRFRLESRATDLHKVLGETVESFDAAAKAAAVTLKISRNDAVTILADPNRLGQVFTNLLSNAMKFTPKGGRIVVDCERGESECLVTVTDNGLGIRPDDIARLFQPFSQVHDTMQRTQAGTGLGLYICRGIIEDLGGSIGAQSSGLGKGSTFWFRLPLKRPAPPMAEVGATTST